MLEGVDKEDFLPRSMPEDMTPKEFLDDYVKTGKLKAPHPLAPKPKETIAGELLKST